MYKVIIIDDNKNDLNMMKNKIINCNKLELECFQDVSKIDMNKNYDAVFLGIGANVPAKMNIPGEELEGVFGGNTLLEKGNHPDYTDKIVAVSGGGNVAMDCARTIKRLGAKKVYVICRCKK